MRCLEQPHWRRHWRRRGRAAKDSGETVRDGYVQSKGSISGWILHQNLFPGSYRVTIEGPTPVHRLLHKRIDSATTLVAPESAPASPVPPPMEPAMIPKRPRKADIREASQIIVLAHGVTNGDTCHARLKLEREQASLTQRHYRGSRGGLPNVSRER